MHRTTILSFSAVAASLVLVTGCTTVPAATNTNVVSNTNIDTTNQKTNAVVANENTNITNTNSEVDTSDWLTYTNEVLPLSFKYPKDWKLERTQDRDDFTEVLDNNDIYDHELVNLYIHWSDRHEDIVYGNGVTNPTLDRWLSCDYIYDLQSKCNVVLINKIEVVKREGQIEPPFGDHYVALAYKQNDFTVVINARALLRESLNGIGNDNLDGLQYINAVIETMSVN
ncbi:MAG: hypothetical protein HYV33_02255 [Candidatus Kerfeldbacteria bacterium]|nr:hypothetical protein [Candidatus Kerfeldbacteria bacterium]